MIRSKKLHLLLLTVLTMASSTMKSQTTQDAILMNQSQTCFALIADFNSFDEYWEGSNLRTNASINTVNRLGIVAMAAFGVFNDHNVIVSVPYVRTWSTQPTGALLRGVNTVSDVSASVKSQWLKTSVGTSTISLLTTGTFTFPVSNYNPDYQPYSPDLRTLQFGIRGIGQFETENGLYARASAAYWLRGSTTLDRNSYYYNDNIVYSNEMFIPNAVQYQVSAGSWLLDKQLRVEAQLNGLLATDGDDIRSYARPQPTNNVQSTQLGLFAQIYFDKQSRFGAVAYGNMVIDGMNVGKTTGVGIGFTYLMDLNNNANTSAEMENE